MPDSDWVPPDGASRFCRRTRSRCGLRIAMVDAELSAVLPVFVGGSCRKTWPSTSLDQGAEIQHRVRLDLDEHAPGELLAFPERASRR